MFKVLFKILSVRQKRALLALQILVIASGLLEVASVIAIGYFIKLISDVNTAQYTAYLEFIVQLFKPYNVITLIGILTLLVLLLSTIFAIVTVWFSALLSNKLGASLKNSLYDYYLHQTWLFHSLRDSSNFTKKITFETKRITNILMSVIIINQKIILIIFMSVMLFIVNPVITLSILILFSCVYLLVYKIINKKLRRNGSLLSEHNKIHFQLMSDGFGGIKDILLLQCQNLFSRNFAHSSRQIVYAASINSTLTHAPKHVIELMTLAIIIVFIIYAIENQGQDFANVLPTITLYILAGLKLLPAFQAVYAKIGAIKGDVAALDVLKEDLNNSQRFIKIHQTQTDSNEALAFNRSIELKNVCFTYPNKQTAIINSLNLTIEANKTIGLVGESGAGKSTIIDLILGLIPAGSGQIVIDDTKLTANKMQAWQKTAGHVPQHIFLINGSIKENVAFGIDKNNIDEQKLKKAIVLAHLNEVVENLAHGIETLVGERGVKLSGGQRQRIGIARALYHNPGMLLLDEATSSLDGLSEKIVMDAIEDFGGKKTIIIVAHRLKTVKKCDVIYLIDKGRVVAHGSYDALIKGSSIFQQMVQHA